MKRALILITALITCTTFSAQAEQPALSNDASYIAASRCLAYANLPQLQSDAGDYAALRSAAEHYNWRDAAMEGRIRSDTRQIRVHADTLAQTEGGLRALRQSRTDSCARFVPSGLVQSDAAPHA
jgi:hypothetical protein